MLNNTLIRKDFPILEEYTYLDSASTSLTPIPVIDAINEYYLKYNANIGRGAYKISIEAGSRFENTRKLISKTLNTSPEEIIFTKNTTEGINLIANGFQFKKGDNVIISNIEHHSNYIPWLNLKNKINIKILQANKYGIINPNDLHELIDENTRIISISHINNAIGSLQPIKEIQKIAKDKGIILMVDCAQSYGHIPLDIKADIMVFPGHKGIMGPVGTGFIYIKKEIQKHIKPVNLGGGTITTTQGEEFTLEQSPHCYEAGTQNIAGIFGLKKAIEYTNTIGIENIDKYTSKLTTKLYEELNQIENIKVYGKKDNIKNIVSFSLNNLNPHDVSKILDETGNICVRSGHHCTIPTLNQIECTQGTIRASLHCYNNQEDIEKLIEIINEISKVF